MRITIVNQYYPPDLSPTAHLAASLAEHRASRGDEVTVITSAARYAGGGDPTAGDAENDNPRVCRTPAPNHAASSLAARARQYVGFYLAASRRLRGLPPQDVVVSMTTPPYIAFPCARLKRRRQSTKVVLWNMDCYPEILEATKLIKRGGLIARYLAFLNRRLFRRLDHIVCLDEAMRDRLQSYAPRDLPVTVIPNWESAALFPDDPDVPRWAGIAELGLSDRFIVLYLGNAGYGHSFETVLDAAERLRDTPVTFLFVGGGSKHDEIKAAAKRRGLTNVVLHGYVPKSRTPSVLAAADLSLITLDDDALGVMCPSKLHANLAMGVPVVYVGPPGGNVDHAIETFHCGLRVAHGDSAELSNFARTMLDDPGRLDELRRAARRAFDEAYCDQRTLPRFDDLIADLSAEPDQEAAPNHRGVAGGDAARQRATSSQ